jgi:uncharacterized membrane protein YhiD involved in acid resistance
MLDLNAVAPVSLVNFVINLFVGLILALVVGWYYEHYGQSLSNRAKFAQLLPVLALTTALVISIVKSSLALSLGLVGALSIVRFRTAIKEPEELLFLFLAIAIGLGVGADQRWVTVVGVAFVLGYMAFRRLTSQKPQSNNLYLNVMVKEDDDQTSLFNQVNAMLLEHVDVLDFRRLDSRDGTLQLTYFVDCYDPQTLNDLVDDLKRRLPIHEVSFIQQDQVLGG